jgi:hypothetical protein
MRKALLPMFASLLLCGAATAALVATNARAQTAPRRPVMMALVSSTDLTAAAPPVEGGPPPDMMPDRGARREQMCHEMYAHKVGEIAYLEAKFALTPAQTPLFARWKNAALDVARAHQSDCTSHQRPDRAERANLIDRLGEEEKMLKRRIADIQAERPALEAFYNSLTQAQKAEMTHGHDARMGERMHRMAGMMDHGGPHGPDGRPPIEHGPDAPPPQ